MSVTQRRRVDALDAARRQRVDTLDAARQRRQDAFLASLDEDDLLALAEVLARAGDTDVPWRGDAECERAYTAFEDVADSVALDDATGPFHDAGVRAAARELVEVVRREGYVPWGEVLR